MRVSSTRLQRNFGAAAAEYDRRATFQRDQARQVLETALLLLPEQALLADIGCGTGYFSEIARAKRVNWRVIGVDLAWGMCEVAARRELVVNADARRLPFANGVFDGIVSSLCYQWVEDLPRAFDEVMRILRPGGRAIIATLGEASLCELRDSAQAVGLPLQLLPMRDFTESKTTLTAAGLSLISADRIIERRYYESVAALMESMRSIGAGNNFSPADAAFIGPKRWRLMVEHYERKRDTQGVPASWEHHRFVLHKPG